MNKKLNWKKDSFVKRIVMALICTTFLNYTYSQNQLKIRNKDANNNIFPYLKIGVGGDFPCGEFFSISLEDENRYIFSAASAFNATLAADGTTLDYPEDGIGANGKRAYNPMSYQKSFNRIIGLKVGYINGTLGEKWTLEANQLRSFYPHNIFDVKYDGQPRMAFDQNNLFYEMLISIQVLAHKNESLTATVESQEQIMTLLIARIERLESALNISNQNIPNRVIGNVSINPNPNTDGNLLVEYTIKDNTTNVQLILTDMQGKTVHQTVLKQIEGNKKLNINLPSGTYLYQLQNKTQQTIAQKLIIQ